MTRRSISPDLPLPARTRSLLQALGLTVCALCLVGCQSTETTVVEDERGGIELAAPSENEPAALGRYHLGKGENGLAQRQLQIAVERNPKDGSAWLALAAAYDNLSRFDLADRAYSRAAGLDGITLEFLNNRGYSYLLRGDGRRALLNFRKALALSPENEVILNNIRLLELGQKPARTTRL